MVKTAKSAFLAEGTRARLIGSAITLLRRSGLSGAGINEIVRESGAPKGSVYHFFPGGKEQIVAEALDQHALAFEGFVEDALAGRRSPAQKVKALFEAFAQRVEDGKFQSSCPLGTVCLDLGAEMDGLRSVVVRSFEQYVDILTRHFGSRAFAGMLLTAIEGGYIRSRAEQSGKPFLEAGAWLSKLAGEADGR